jgi:hypothetical protein
MKKTIIAIWTWISRVVSGPELPPQTPTVQLAMPHLGASDAQDDERRAQNQLDVALADLRQQRLGLQHTIRLAHRSNAISFLAVLVAIAALVVTLRGQRVGRYHCTIPTQAHNIHRNHRG